MLHVPSNSFGAPCPGLDSHYRQYAPRQHDLQESIRPHWQAAFAALGSTTTSTCIGPQPALRNMYIHTTHGRGRTDGKAHEDVVASQVVALLDALQDHPQARLHLRHHGALLQLTEHGLEEQHGLPEHVCGVDPCTSMRRASVASIHHWHMSLAPEPEQCLATAPMHQHPHRRMLVPLQQPRCRVSRPRLPQSWLPTEQAWRPCTSTACQRVDPVLSQVLQPGLSSSTAAQKPDAALSPELGCPAC